MTDHGAIWIGVSALGIPVASAFFTVIVLSWRYGRWMQRMEDTMSSFCRGFERNDRAHEELGTELGQLEGQIGGVAVRIAEVERRHGELDLRCKFTHQNEEREG